VTAISLRLTLLLALLWAAPAWAAESPAAAGTPRPTSLNDTRSTLEKWVETRQLISKTRSDWQSDREMLEQSIQLFERELKAVEDQMTKLSTNSTQADKERAQADAQVKSANESLDRTKQFATGFESEMNKLVPRLPKPLQEILKPLLAKLPSDPANTKMAAAERAQVIVGILNEIDKFNNAVTIFSEKRKNDQGEEIAVQTVYLGLGAAYFVSDAGDLAGTGTAGANGWDWTVKNELASSIKEVLRIYRNERPPRFISLPATIK
jgi:septal ring factor EnvC (AmiA/AmiB activator)